MFQLKSKSTHSVNNDNIQPSLIKNDSNVSSNLLEKYSNLNLSIDSLDSLDSVDRRDSAISDITENDSKDNLIKLLQSTVPAVSGGDLQLKSYSIGDAILSSTKPVDAGVNGVPSVDPKCSNNPPSSQFPAASSTPAASNAANDICSSNSSSLSNPPVLGTTTATAGSAPGTSFGATTAPAAAKNVVAASAGGIASEDRRLSGESFLLQFNSKINHYDDKIYVINLDHTIELLNFYYNVYNNGLDQDLFPFLHGLHNSRQRIFFHKDFKNLDNDHFDINDFKKFDLISYPMMRQLHLMFLNTHDDEFKLNNSIKFEELMDRYKKKSMPERADITDEDGIISDDSFFDDIDVDEDDVDDLNNRNFKDQIKIYSQLSNFVLYNNGNNLSINLNKAVQLSKHTNKFIYVINFNTRHWQLIPSEYLNNSNFQQIHQLPINSINNQVFNCQLLKWEQNLLWKYNSMKWFNRNICVGNLIDYNYLTNINHDFKLILNCHEYGNIPKPHSLTHVDYLEFPSSGYLNFDLLNLSDLINYLNLLKHIKLLVDNQESIFIFSFDGFTGLTLLLLSIGLMVNDNITLEELILSIYSQNPELKLYFFKNDLIFLKKFEKFIQYGKRQTNSNRINFINYNELPPTKFAPDLDWFNFNKDNNFPCKIYNQLHLGSLNHANSTTIMNCMKFTRLLSIGEKPIWIKPNILKKASPIYQFQNEQHELINVYELKGKQIPSEFKYLKSVVFIENLKDDGKDSLLPLLVNCPATVQRKILYNPTEIDHEKVLYHCKIGVSRLASLVIASLMKFLNLSLIESYMMVRIKRFNIIIQPNLRIFYDLYLFENYLNYIRGKNRHYTWYHLCNEIYKLNRNYIE